MFFLLIDREEFRRLDFKSRTDFQNRRECRIALAVLDETDEGPVEAGEFGEFFLRYLFGFAFFLENFAKDLFFVLCHWMNR